MMTERRQDNTRRFVLYTVILLVLSYLFLFYGLGGYSLKEPDEGRYAEIPREMAASGDYTVPRLNDVRYFEKPPFLYWSVAASYKVFGISEWSFRFPNALAAALCVFSLFFFIRRWTDESAAFLGALVLLSSLGFYAMARIVTTDMVLTLWLFLSLLCFYGYYREGKTPFVYGFYAAMALATLAKGPVAPVLLAGAIVIFLFAEGNLAFIRRMKIVPGFLVYLVIAAPWFIVMSIREKEFFNFFFIDQHILRFVSTKHKRSGPLYYFIPILLGGMLPWSLFIPRAVAALWKRPECRLLVIWSAVVFFFFSISGSKLPPYILPVFPALSAVVGVLFHERRESFLRRPWEVVVLGIFTAVLAFSTLLYFNQSFMNYIADISMDSLGIMRDLKGFSLWISITSFLCLVFFVLRPFRQTMVLFIVLLLFSLSTVMAIMAESPVIDRVNTAKGLALAAAAERKNADVIVNYSALDLTLPFYLGAPVVIASYTGELAMGSKYDDARDMFMTDEEFFRLLDSGRKVLFVTKSKRIDDIEKRSKVSIRTRMCQNDRCLLSNY